MNAISTNGMRPLDAIDRVHTMAGYLETLLRHVWEDLETPELLHVEADHPHRPAMTDVTASLSIAQELVTELQRMAIASGQTA